MDHTSIKKEITRLFKYGNVTLLSYLALIAGTALLTDIISMNSSYAYAITLVLVYVGVYFASSRYVFQVENNRHNFYKFLVVVSILFLLHNFVFNVFVLYFAIHYVLAIILNLLILGPVRYLIYKKWVFPNNATLHAKNENGDI